MLAGKKGNNFKNVKPTRAHQMISEVARSKISASNDAYGGTSLSAQQREFKMRRFNDIKSKIDNKRQSASRTPAPDSSVAVAPAAADVPKVRPEDSN